MSERLHIARKILRRDTEESFYLGAVCNVNENGVEHWTKQIKIGHTPVQFRIDTGANVTVMNMRTFKALKPKRHLIRARKPLDSPGGALKTVGYFTACTLHRQKKHIFTVYVATGPTVNNLLGRETAIEMGLVKRVEQVSTARGHAETLKTDPVKIHLKEGAVPYAVHSARRVPIPLLSKVQAELQRMKEHRVIERVTQPTD